MTLRRRTVEVLIAAGLLGVALAPPASATGQGHEVSLRVATYNIHAGAGMDNVFDLDRQTAELRSLDADVIGLQEVDVHWGTRSEWRDLAAELAERLHMQVSFAPIYSLDPDTPGAPRREFGVAVLSRYRIVSAENHEITRLSTQDPNPVPAPAPGFGEVVLRVKGLPVHVYVTHLDYRGDPSVRTAQVADTRRVMAEDEAPGRQKVRQILLGDFNAAPAAPELAPLWKELTDVEPGGPTYPAQDPVQRIDYVAVSKDSVRVRDAAVAETLASDHRPVVADLLLRR
ncbi:MULTISPECIES: endonuclease/exonuclease/phosphatase family protein [unclassified Streptomyces]|uniref:endonuclease/exonuclease/phosphatase family protein n=1 Tax=unclassified Streptomyces TaxID=2593676 RepID=UPI0022517016|nr:MULTISPECIES: endonuclease/exonuclease/phosphatase family protein [unclassified Streptomyces]WSP56341.1 endonuclease/exonuclease/phosphatase family protein [Streptomyces sp. NBC_01241]WSU22942.1 endonuclease/exonuclease/phosphatase family protein [Streptomyces sp. NBC_01108]MCX4788066.1 endonuclease/exonuclease/phosphatase family protein [Streptomyces sp. NBC_01221]MCX4796173.1 endonuclease/exonuclease/phosphatase family protein [Streptomyces sp. NBC_01242]WSJ37427.1 endonuclease/exonucleas